MAPKLYGFFGSPPFGAVLMCAKELGLELEIVIVDFNAGDHLKEDFVKINPQRTVPLLEDDGFYLADSHAINAYLVGKYGKENDPLYPKHDIKRKAIIDHRQYMDSSIVAANAFQVTRPLFLKKIKPTVASIENFREALQTMDRQIEIQNTKYIAGDVLSIADFSNTVTITSWGYFLPNWPEEFPNINAYIERMKKEDWFNVNDEGWKNFKAIMDLLMK
ncbi:unnamed protein product [Ceutorhynchus assimilis]|uniref:Glutathione S-transferase n=1 Tax=Ceutorhynchus assimilis TaxID=467358 RepID=A0A9N9QRA2_9CUCU|nr:unnamed protein product [Ceutorhynchus assimilis]